MRHVPTMRTFAFCDVAVGAGVWDMQGKQTAGGEDLMNPHEPAHPEGTDASRARNLENGPFSSGGGGGC